MSTIYVVERVYSSSELPLKAFRVKAEARGEIAVLNQQNPGWRYHVRELELVED
jgi:hypothetical protein